MKRNISNSITKQYHEYLRIAQEVNPKITKEYLQWFCCYKYADEITDAGTKDLARYFAAGGEHRMKTIKDQVLYIDGYVEDNDFKEAIRDFFEGYDFT